MAEETFPDAYGYEVSASIAAVAAVVFLILSLLHLYQMVRIPVLTTIGRVNFISDTDVP